jgi:hypothetical protein
MLKPPMNPTDHPQAHEFAQARSELLEGIESSRQMVRQSRLLIELAECDGLPANDNEDCGVAN